MMLFLQAAPGAAEKMVHGAAEAAGEKPPFETDTLLSPLYHAHLLNEHIIPESVLISLIMAALIALFCFLLTRRLSVHRPSKTQAALELVVSSLDNMVIGLIGPDGPRYLPLVGSLFIYILVLNLAGLVPLWKTPTANLNVTISLALVAVIYVQYHGIRANGFIGYIKHFMGDPIWLAPLNFPLHIIGEFARLISLSFRLFGNMFGEDTVIAILIMLGAPLLFPMQFPMLLMAVFTSLVQAMVFTMLTCMYIAGFVTHEEHMHHGHEHHPGEEEKGLFADSPLPVPPA